MYSAKVLWKHDLLWSNSIFWFFLVYSLTGWCAFLSPVTIKTYLLPGSVASIANFFLSAKRKKHFTTLLSDIEDLNITRKHTLAPGHCFHISVETFLSHEATTTNHKARRKRLKTITLNVDLCRERNRWCLTWLFCD